MDFISQFNQALAQYFTTHANLNFADQSGQSQNLNTLESKAFWMALGDIVELDGCPELSEGIRNGICMVSCKDGEHSAHCSSWRVSSQCYLSVDFITQFDQVLAQYFPSHISAFADHESLTQHLNASESELQVFWMALGDIVELDGCPELSQEIRNGVCMVSCKDGDHSPHCSLHSFNSFRPLASTIPVMMPEKQSYYDQACQEMKDHLDLDFSDDSNLD